jgi:hypothetical protein
MKKIIGVLVLFLLAAIVATAQEYHYVPFPTSNAIWSEMYWKSISSPYPRWQYHQYALFDDDTIINSLTYQKLYMTYSSEITRQNSFYVGALREDMNKKVYVKYDEKFKPDEPYYKKEFLLFDFNKNIGDTIWAKDSIELGPLHFIIVKQIDTLKINNSLRKVYSFDPIQWVYWIEGIGSVKGLLFTSGDLPTNGMDNDLICMHHNDTLLYYYPGPDSIYDDCVPTAVLDGVALLPMNYIKVYPNPVSAGSVCFENLEYDQLELFDTNGRSVAMYGITGQTSFMVDVSPLPRGIYNYRLWSKGFIPVCGKLMVK